MAHCDEMHVEKLSAVARCRPVYESVIASLTAGDTFLVWDLDRAYRSTVDAITEAERLRARGIEFQIVNLKVDTSTPAGMLVYTMISAFAEFERRTLSQRTREGLAAARRRGQRLGRPSKLSDAALLSAARRLDLGEKVCAVAEELDVAPWTLTRALTRRAATALAVREGSATGPEDRDRNA